ncbi:MAG: FtsX-like permease family protein [Myxococcales bacterium]|nr:FtsX-like permease family protein [Myxococcales bacterium]MDH5308039.1 FtsX-like permease family protein [Myxococcales bacterium]MDH5567264.1 FtsX-like permease family protein [Myxococcales bacterium]
MLVIRMAWRNAWRHKRRTSIVAIAVAVGITGTLLSIALNYGMINQMIDTAIATDLGHVQVHARGYESDPELHVQIEDGARAPLAALASLPEVRGFARRVRAEGLISSPRASAGVRVVGIEPEAEARVSLIADSVLRGAYLDERGARVLLGEALARRLEVDLGDKVVLSVQDLAGDLTGDALRVEGIFRTPSSALDRGNVFVRLDRAQALFGLGDAITEVVVRADSRAAAARVRDALAARLPDLEVRSWDQREPALLYLVDLSDQSALIVYAAIFTAMAFGIANVLLMTVFERRQEIGVLTAIGFGRARLVATIAAEALVVTGLGLLAGFGGAAGVVWALRDGIDLSAFAEGLTAYGIGTRVIPLLRGQDFVAPLVVALVTAALASAWPAWRAVRLRPAEAVRQP